MNKELTKEIQQQITHLLLSSEDINLSMALEMIEETQATSLFEMELFLAYQFSGNKKNKKTISSLIKQTENTKLQYVFNKKYGFKTAEYKKILEYINIIPKEAGFNKSAFAFTIYKITKEKAIDYLLEHGTTEERKELLKGLTKEGVLTIKSDIITQLPEEITSFTKLKNLKVHCPELKEFPVFLTTMQHIEKLDISGMHFCALPNTFYHLKKLKELNISYTHYLNYDIDYSIIFAKMPSLEKLTISRSQLHKYKQLSKLTFLKQLVIHCQSHDDKENKVYKETAKKALPNCDIIAKF